jgi:hypothetical protein
MPIYEYICKKCNENFPFLQRVDIKRKILHDPDVAQLMLRKRYLFLMAFAQLILDFLLRMGYTLDPAEAVEGPIFAEP